MFRISYRDRDGNLAHKGGFQSDKEAYTWLNSQTDIIPYKLLVWSEDIQAYRTLETF